jgi:hypothetical protein
MQLKRCPRCSGSVALEKDHDGPYLRCFVCGWLLDLQPSPPPPPKRAGRAAQLVTPESVEAPNLGCSVAKSCFECPLPDCKYEAPTARDTYLRGQALLAVFREHQHLGTKVAAELTAKAVGTTDRSVYRALSRQQKLSMI